MSRQTQAEKQKRHWYRPSSIAAWPCRKHPGPLNTRNIIKDTSHDKVMRLRRKLKTDHHDDNMQITHIGIIMITLTRAPMTNLCSKHTVIHFIYAKFVPMTLVSNYPKILRNTRWQNCALSNTLMKIQITLLFKTLHRGPVCQFHPREAYVRNFKYTTLLVPVWRKFNWTTASAPNKNVKERILIKRQFNIDQLIEIHTQNDPSQV